MRPNTQIRSVLDLPPEDRAFFELRFWACVEKTRGCWIWHGWRDAAGYGRFVGSRCSGHFKYSAHRAAYELVKSKIPEGLTIDHLCRNRACVNPEHLEPVTMKENIDRSPIAPATLNSRKTHCPKGHSLEEDNLSKSKLRQGKRACRSCINQQAVEYRQREKIILMEA